MDDTRLTAHNKKRAEKQKWYDLQKAHSDHDRDGTSHPGQLHRWMIRCLNLYCIIDAIKTCYPSESPLLSQSLLRSTPTPRPHSDHMENVMPFATVNSSITMKTWQARFSFQTNKNRSNLHSRHGNEVQQQPVSFPWTAMHLAIEELVRNRFNFLNHNCCCYSSTAK